MAPMLLVIWQKRFRVKQLQITVLLGDCPISSNSVKYYCKILTTTTSHLCWHFYLSYCKYFIYHWSFLPACSVYLLDILEQTSKIWSPEFKLKWRTFPHCNLLLHGWLYIAYRPSTNTRDKEIEKGVTFNWPFSFITTIYSIEPACSSGSAYESIHSFNILEDLLLPAGENNNHAYLYTNVLALRGA